jgi:hypothetical protein
MSLTNYEAYLPNYVNNRVSAIIDNAPTNLNTLSKVASAIGNDPYFVATSQTGLNAKQNVINDPGLPISKVDGLQPPIINK